MRLIFKKGKQLEILEQYRKMQGEKCWSAVARRLEVSPNALKEWRYETVSLPLEIYSKVDPSKLYSEWIVEKRSDVWGQTLGAKISTGRKIRIKVPEKSERLAEFFGIILGDGNVYVNRKHKANQVRIACHPIHERDYALFVSGLFRDIFCINAALTKRKNALYVGINNRELVEFLLKELPGLQEEFVFPAWILEDEKCLRAFVRGLTDTDGSVYRLSRKDPHIIRIGFKNADKCLSSAYRDALIKLGFHPSILTHRNIFLTRKEDTKRYLKEIGSNNMKHKNRLLKMIAP